MNVYGLFSLLCTLPLVFGQNGNPRVCRILCGIVDDCASRPISSLCRPSGVRWVRIFCGCGATTTSTTTTTTTTTPRRPPPTRSTPPPTTDFDECGIGNIPSKRIWLDSRPKIVGGEDTKQGDFPWQVKLRVAGAHCGGSIIDKYTILTAAHCVDGFENSTQSTVIYYGSVDLSNLNMVPRTNPSRIIMHPGYATSSQPDLALLKLSTPLQFSGRVQAICLPKQKQAIPTGQFAVVSGWGLQNEGGSVIPNRMRFVRVPIVNQATCNDDYSGTIRNSEVCAGYPDGGRDACQGDSGGALVMPNQSNRWEVVGIVSRGTGCARRNKPGIYTRVPEYVSWIERFMGPDV